MRSAGPSSRGDKNEGIFFVSADLIVALDGPAGNTSLPTGRQATPWNAGFVEIGWATVDFTKSEVQSRRRRDNGRSCSTFKRFHSKAFSSVPAGSVMVIFLQH